MGGCRSIKSSTPRSVPCLRAHGRVYRRAVEGLLTDRSRRSLVPSSYRPFDNKAHSGPPVPPSTPLSPIAGESPSEEAVLGQYGGIGFSLDFQAAKEQATGEGTQGDDRKREVQETYMVAERHGRNPLITKVRASPNTVQTHGEY